MLKKSIVISTAALAFGILGLAANGCSVTATGPGPITGGDGSTSDVKKIPPGDSGDTDSGAPTCYDFSTSFAYNFGPPVAYQNVCSSTQISGYLAACFSPGTAATCTAFIDANPYCSVCIGADVPAADSGVAYDAGANNDGGAGNIPYPALVQVDQTAGLTTANLDGCIAALSTGTDSCKTLDDQLSTCISSSCSSCDQTDTAAQNACITAAQGDTAGCSSTFVLDSTCQSALTASQTANSTACGGDKTTFQDQYMAVATVLCGAHP